MNLGVNRIFLKLFHKNEQKFCAFSRNLCNSCLYNKSRIILINSSANKINQTSKKYISKCLPMQVNESAQRNQPPLMLTDLPHTVFPNIFKVIALRLRIAFQMFQMDKTFRFDQFLTGTEQAALYVSNLIAMERFEQLNGLVYDETIEEIKNNFYKLTPQQKKSIAIEKNDLHFELPYDFVVNTTNNRTFAKISLLFYYIPGSGELIERAKFDAKLGFELNEKFRNEFIIADYRFAREFTPNQKSDSWLITELNHWKLMEHYKR